jgi:hypothetical protein
VTYGSTQIIQMMQAIFPVVSEAVLGDRLRFWSRSGYLQPVQRHVGTGRATAWPVVEAKRAILMQVLVSIGMQPYAALCLIQQIRMDLASADIQPFAGVTVSLNLEEIFSRSGFPS